jgi:hypothetical protein
MGERRSHQRALCRLDVIEPTNKDKQRHSAETFFFADSARAYQLKMNGHMGGS